MEKTLGKQTADALFWKFLDFIAVKVVFLVRLLVLASLLPPEDFGLLAIGVTAVTLLLQLSDFGIVPALIQRPGVTDQDYDTGWTIDLARAVLVTTVIVFAAPWIAGVFGELRATPIIQVLAVGVVVDALASVKIARLNRKLEFRALTVLHLVQAAATTTVAIAMASRYGVWALVAGSLAGSLAYTLTSYLVAPHRPRLQWRKSAVLGLFDFGRWLFLTGVIIMIANAGLRAIISRQLGIAELGIFFLAGRLAFLPYLAIVEVVESVAFPVYARLQEMRAKAREFFRAALLGMATLLIPACLLLVALAPGLVEHVLGERWAGTTTAIQVLALSSPLGLAMYAATPLLKGFGLPSRVTVFELLQSGLRLALAWILIGRIGLLGAVVAWLIAVLVSQPIGIVYTRANLHQPYAGLWRPVGVVSAASIAGALTAAWLDASLPGLPGFLLAATTGLAGTFGLILGADRYLGLGLVHDLTRHFPAVSRFFSTGGSHENSRT